MKSKNIAFITFCLLALAVAFGAIGSHALKPKLSEACLETFKTGARYHMYLSIILLSIAALSFGSRIYFSWSLAIYLLGFALFVGGCYISAFREIAPQIGEMGSKMAPIGGVFLIFSFLIMALQTYMHKLK